MLGHNIWEYRCGQARVRGGRFGSWRIDHFLEEVVVKSVKSGKVPLLVPNSKRGLVQQVSGQSQNPPGQLQNRGTVLRCCPPGPTYKGDLTEYSHLPKASNLGFPPFSLSVVPPWH